ncbi:MAG: glycosyltransferase family 1 protein [Phycisphaeraceae bacterium]
MPSKPFSTLASASPVIGLDARTLTRQPLRGIGVSTARLYARLTALRPDWRFIAFHQTPRPPAGERLEAENLGWQRIDVPGDRLDAWTQLRLPWQALREKVDLLHCPANWCPIWQPVPMLVTVHDLIPLTSSQRADREPVIRFRLALEAAKRASGILTPSSYVAGEIERRLPIVKGHVTVVPWGADAVRGVDPDPEHVRLEPAGIGQRFVLHLAAPDLRKNTRRVIEAWSLLPSSVRSEVALVLVGMRGSFRDEMLGLTRRLGVETSVRFLEPVERARLESLMREAEVLAYPSLSEGFGLPVIEAFARETAVLSSDVTSIPEVAGDAAELVDPRNTMAIRNGLERLLTQPHRRRFLVNAGRERVKAFRWDDAAIKLAGVIEHTLGMDHGLRMAA